MKVIINAYRSDDSGIYWMIFHTTGYHGISPNGETWRVTPNETPPEKLKEI